MHNKLRVKRKILITVGFNNNLCIKTILFFLLFSIGVLFLT